METLIKENTSGAKMDWGLSAQGEPIHITQVESGLACQCICPGCQDRLVARKGNINAHHFAHDVKAETQACSESALHFAAKHVLKSASRVSLPAAEIAIKDLDSARLQKITIDGGFFNYVKSYIEQSRGNYRPDTTVENSSFTQMDVEILVTHEVDEVKYQKVKQVGIDMLEVDLSDLIGKTLAPQELQHQVLELAPRKWIHRTHQQDVTRLVTVLQKHCEHQFSLAQSKIKRAFDTEVKAKVTMLTNNEHGQIEGLKKSIKAKDFQLSNLLNAVNSEKWVVTADTLYTLVGMKVVPGYSILSKDRPLMAFLEVLRDYPRGTEGRPLNHKTHGYQPVRMEMNPELIDQIQEQGIEFPVVARLGINGMRFGRKSCMSYVESIELQQT